MPLSTRVSATTWLKIAAGWAVLLMLVPGAARAQGSTEDKINQAVALYNKFEIEAARPLLQEVLSPTWLQPISVDQRVKAYKYLGASYAVIGKADSAAPLFVAALAYDAFTDLDRSAFSASELAAFDLAKTKIFKIGIQTPLRAKVVNPQSSTPDSTSYTFRITTTQRAAITVTLTSKAAKDSGLNQVLFRGQSDGVHDIPWDGRINNRLAPAGTYEFKVSGISSQPGASPTPTVEQQDLTIEHSFETLEDTLRSFLPSELLVENYDSKAPIWDLIKGVSLGLATAAIPVFALDQTRIAPSDQGKWKAQWTIAAGVGVGAGLFSFSYRRSHLLRQDAVNENTKRRQARQQFNEGVKRRNDAKLAKTKLLIAPFGYTW